MYVLLFGALFAIGFWLVSGGLRLKRRSRVVIGGLIWIISLLFMALMALSAELLWFDSLGYSARFWTFIWARVIAVALGVMFASLIVWGFTWRLNRYLRFGLIGLAAAGGFVWGMNAWQSALLFINRESSGLQEPMLGLDVGFYLFTLPLLGSLFFLALWVAALVLFAAVFLHQSKREHALLRIPHDVDPAAPLRIPRASLALSVVLAFGTILSVFHLLYSQMGVVMGPGWTDIHIRFPALLVMVAIFIVAGALPLSARFRTFMNRLAQGWLPHRSPVIVTVFGAWGGIVALWVLLVVITPALVQWLVVRPNEITYEVPYIAHNIDYTRKAFRLDMVEERQFSADEELTPQTRLDNSHLLSEIRLWDWRALDAVYKQFQEIRLYYEFVDVDIDRYQIGDRYRQVMVAVREMAQRNLPPQSQTFVNKRFKYTHGYGYTLAPVSDFTAEGLPNLLVKNIPPVAADPVLAVDRPEIYYGELTDEPVVVNTLEPEFDYPSGEKNIYSRYQGQGGVLLSNFWRRFLFAWKFDGTLLLFSSYPTDTSRVLFHRRIQERVQKVAPFLEFDQDPYIAAVDGRLVWIVDAYTSSSYFPYSQSFDSHEFVETRNGTAARQDERTVARLSGQNYVRNSVKAVVDAYDGSVKMYVFDKDDVLIKAWMNALPGMFLPGEVMPSNLRAHIRYPQDLLLVQGLIFNSYHMTDPAVFYNQEDLWVRATEKHYNSIKPVEPYYVMWELPGSDNAEFVLMLPFTPKNRQVLIGWIAGLSDGENYGRLIAYKFPKEKRVLGPQQVETKIDQDSFLSGQLTLWNQQGSEVIRGNVLAIPVDDSLLYVEPIYLRAETSAYPELRLVAVMQGDKLSYARTFEEALLGLFEKSTSRIVRSTDASIPDLAAEAQRLFNAYLAAMGERAFDEASAALTQLGEVLDLMGAATPAETE